MTKETSKNSPKPSKTSNNPSKKIPIKAMETKIKKTMNSKETKGI